ncbi:MBL fold metallo-hydrolase [Eubacteriales bacterium KG127]
MIIKTIPLGYLKANCYIVHKASCNEGIVIDCGYNSSLYTDYIVENDLQIKAILLTHRHPDHVNGAEKLSAKLGCPVYMHRLDADYYKGHVDTFLEGGEILDIARFKIRVHHTPGHTPGGVCFEFIDEKIIFSGDTIFDIDLGTTGFPGGCEEDLMWSCQNVIDKWNDDIQVYPGHDVSATMAYIRENNREFNLLKEGKAR